MPDRELLTIDEAREKVGEGNYRTSKPIDFSEKSNRIDHDGDDYVLIQGKRDRRITKGGMSNLVRVMGLPVALPTKVAAHPDLVKEFLNKVAERRSLIYRALSKNNSVVSFTDGDQTIISNSQILDSAEKVLGEPQFDRVKIEDDGDSSFAIVSDKNNKLKVKDDKFLGGVRVENNPFRSQSTKIEAYLERLVCLNGQIAPSALWSAPKTIEDDVGEWVTSNIGHAFKASEGMFNSIANLADRKIDADMMDFLENMYEQLKVPEAARDVITRRIVKEGADTLYDVFNHITYVASNYRAIREDASLSARLMRIGGHFAQHVEAICNACNRPAFTV